MGKNSRLFVPWLPDSDLFWPQWDSRHFKTGWFAGIRNGTHAIGEDQRNHGLTPPKGLQTCTHNTIIDGDITLRQVFEILRWELVTSIFPCCWVSGRGAAFSFQKTPIDAEALLYRECSSRLAVCFLR